MVSSFVTNGYRLVITRIPHRSFWATGELQFTVKIEVKLMEIVAPRHVEMYGRRKKADSDEPR